MVVKWVVVCQKKLYILFLFQEYAYMQQNEFNGLSLSLEISSVLLLI